MPEKVVRQPQARPSSEAEARSALSETKPHPAVELPFRVLQGPGGPALEYDCETRLPDRTVKQPFRLPRGYIHDAILSMMTEYREMERRLALAESERDMAIQRAIGAEADLAQREKRR